MGYNIAIIIGFAITYPVDSDLSSGSRYPSFEQLGPGVDLKMGAFFSGWLSPWTTKPQVMSNSSENKQWGKIWVSHASLRTCILRVVLLFIGSVALCVLLSLCDGNILPLSLIFCQNMRMFPVYCTLNRTFLSESSLQYSEVNEVYSIAFYGSIWIWNTDLKDRAVVWFVKAIGHFQKYHNPFPAKGFPIDK